jgi:hypothetical protein
LWNYYSKIGKTDVLLDRWRSIEEDREKNKEALRVYWEEYARKKELIEEAKKERERQNAIKASALQAKYAKWGKWVGKGFGVLSIIGMLWLFYLLAVWGLPRLSGIGEVLLQILCYFGIMLATVAAGFLIWIIIEFLWNKFILGVWKRWLRNYGEEPWLSKFGNYLIKGIGFVFLIFSQIWNGIVSFFGFFRTMFMAWKNNNCPGIDWEE